MRKQISYFDQEKIKELILEIHSGKASKNKCETLTNYLVYLSKNEEEFLNFKKSIENVKLENLYGKKGE